MRFAYPHDFFETVWATLPAEAVGAFAFPLPHDRRQIAAAVEPEKGVDMGGHDDEARDVDHAFPFETVEPRYDYPSGPGRAEQRASMVGAEGSEMIAALVNPSLRSLGHDTRILYGAAAIEAPSKGACQLR